MIDIDDVPECKAKPPLRYSKRITIPIEADHYEKLELLKRDLNKNTAELVRMLLADFFKTIEWSAGA